QVLSDAFEPRDTPAEEAGAELARRREKEVARRGRLDLGHGAPHEHPLDLPTRDLDFGELRHETGRIVRGRLAPTRPTRAPLAPRRHPVRRRPPRISPRP